MTDAIKSSFPHNESAKVRQIDHAPRSGYSKLSQQHGTPPACDPFSIARSLPEWALLMEAYDLPLTTRCRNVFHDHGIRQIGDLTKFTLQEALSWRNFGQKSAATLANTLKVALDLNPGHPSRATPESEVLTIPTLLSCLTGALDALPERDRAICRARFGFDGRRWTLEELAREQNVSSERIRQIEARVIEGYIRDHSWASMLSARLARLLHGRRRPLYIDSLEAEDAWFSGVSETKVLFYSILHYFANDEFRMVFAEGRFMVVQRRKKRKVSASA